MELKEEKLNVRQRTVNGVNYFYFIFCCHCCWCDCVHKLVVLSLMSTVLSLLFCISLHTIIWNFGFRTFSEDFESQTEKQRYDGWYNNLAHPEWGSVGMYHLID